MKTIFIMAALMLASCGAQQQTQTATPVKMEQTISLLQSPAKGGMTINEALWNRRSSRDYKPEALSLEELSGVVWAASGINRLEDSHLTAPSALALYPIRTYAFFEQGVYLYDVQKNQLTRITEGDHRAVAGAQPFVAKAPLNLVFVADLSTYEGRNIPVEHTRFLCGQDAAGYVENVNLYAAGHNLKSVTRGQATPELLPLLGLDSTRYMFALAVSVGK